MWGGYISRPKPYAKTTINDHLQFRPRICMKILLKSVSKIIFIFLALQTKKEAFVLTLHKDVQIVSDRNEKYVTLCGNLTNEEKMRSISTEGEEDRLRNGPVGLFIPDETSCKRRSGLRW